MADVQVPLSILLVDDDKNICHNLGLSLTEMNHRVATAQSVDEALVKIKTTDFDLLLTDFKMNGKTALDLITESRRLQPRAQIIVMTAYSSIENAVEVVREGAFDYLPKPFTSSQLAHVLRKLSRVVSLEREVTELKRHHVRHDFFAGFTSKESLRIEDFIRSISPSEATVLITGDSGTGKSELAKLIHELSPRSPASFVTVCCTTLTESLVESELFGHVRGAFTGATKDKIGKLELARKGTLFLDEVGDLSPGAQSKLLRFLQDRIFERVGSNDEIFVDVRIIAATNKDLSLLVSQGKFREDLYYRLNALECYLPPLRERQEDLKVLIDRLITEIRSREDLNAKWSMPPELEKVFLSYPWPGNIRELRNALERLSILSHSRSLTMNDLPKSMLGSMEASRASQTLAACTSLKEMEKQHIKNVLAQEPNFEKASQLLGITSVTLWKKRKEFGLE